MPTPAQAKKILHATFHGISVSQLATATTAVAREEATMAVEKRLNTRATQTWRPA